MPQERPQVAFLEDILVSPWARPQLSIEGTPEHSHAKNLTFPEEILISGFCHPRRPTNVYRSSGKVFTSRPTVAAPHLSDPTLKHDNTPQRRFSAPTSEDSVAESRKSERARKSRLPSHDTVTSILKTTPRQKISLRCTTESTSGIFSTIHSNPISKTSKFRRSFYELSTEGRKFIKIIMNPIMRNLNPIMLV